MMGGGINQPWGSSFWIALEERGGSLRISEDTAGAADIDDDSGFFVLYAEIWGGGLDEFEGRGGMDGEHLLPLLVAELWSMSALMMIP